MAAESSWVNVWTVWAGCAGAILGTAKLCEQYASERYRPRAVDLAGGDVGWIRATAHLMHRLFFGLYTLDGRMSLLKSIVITTILVTYSIRESTLTFVLEPREGSWSDVSRVRLYGMCLVTGCVAGVLVFAWNFRTRTVIRQIRREDAGWNYRLPLWHALSSIAVAVAVLVILRLVISHSGLADSLNAWLEPVPRFAGRAFHRPFDLITDATALSLLSSSAWPFLSSWSMSVTKRLDHIHEAISWLTRFVKPDTPFIALGFASIVVFSGLYVYVVVLKSVFG